MIRFKIIAILLLFACNSGSGNRVFEAGISSDDELQLDIGDCLYFKSSDSTYGCVIVCDLDKENGRIWYGAFYTGYNSREIPTLELVKEGKVMGRKVHSSLDKNGYRKCLDGDFLIDSLITNVEYFALIGNIPLKRVELGSHGALTSMDILQSTFGRRVERRINPPDHFTGHMTKLDKFRPEEYFEMRDFIR
jgi:hypothetical protein